MTASDHYDAEHVEKFADNLNLYKEIVRDPVSYLNEVRSKTGTGEIIERALERRHLTADEIKSAKKAAKLEVSKDDSI